MAKTKKPAFTLPKISSEVVIIVLTLAVFIFSSNRGLTVHDEGYILDAANRFANGEIIYKDFFIQYTPGIVFLLGGLYKMFGNSVLIGRILMVVIGSFIGILLSAISKLFVPKNISLIAPLLFISWGIPHLNFPWPTWFAFLFMLLTLYAIFRCHHNNLWLWVAGFSSTLVFFFKQNFGVVAIVAFSIAVIIKHKLTPRVVSASLLSVLTPFLLLGLYFSFTGSTKDAFDTIVLYNLRYAREGIMSAPFPLPSFISFREVGKTTFFYLPLAYLLYTTSSLFRQKPSKSHIILTIFTASFFLVGLRPTTDILHISLLYPALIPLLIVDFDQAQKNKQSTRKLFMALLILVIISMGIYKLVFKNYAGFEKPYPDQKIPVKLPSKETLLVDTKAIKAVQASAAINQLTSEREEIFVYPFAPMIYFLSGRGNASRYPIVLPTYLTSAQEEEIIQDLSHVNLVVLQQTGERATISSPQELYEYLLANFKTIEQIGDYQIRKRI